MTPLPHPDTPRKPKQSSLNYVTPSKSDLPPDADSQSSGNSTENENAHESVKKRPRIHEPIVNSPTNQELASITAHTSQVKSDCDQLITTFAAKLSLIILDHKHLTLLGSMNFCQLYNRQNQTGFMQLMDWVSVGYWLCCVKKPSEDVVDLENYTNFTAVSRLNHKIEMIIKSK